MEFIANVVKLYRGESVVVETQNFASLGDRWLEYFPKGKYRDIPGLCKVATLEEIREQGYSLNPGRYVGVSEKKEEDFDFYEKLEELNEELERLNLEARELEEKISENMAKLLERTT